MVEIERMNNTPRSSQLSVRSAWLVLVLLLSSIAPVASADLSEPIYTGAPLSDSPEDAPLTYSFSTAIRAAFARVSDLSQYSADELESTAQWVVVSSQALGEPTGILANTWYVEIDSDDALKHFSDLQAKGDIEVAYPLVKLSLIHI